MSPQLHHETLDATLQGIEDDRHGDPVTHYRGLKYGKIPKRFAAPLPADTLQDGIVDCATFG